MRVGTCAVGREAIEQVPGCGGINPADLRANDCDRNGVGRTRTANPVYGRVDDRQVEIRCIDLHVADDRDVPQDQSSVEQDVYWCWTLDLIEGQV